jgi:hypothetical protein
MKPNRDDSAAYKKRTEDALFRAVLSQLDTSIYRSSSVFLLVVG